VKRFLRYLCFYCASRLIYETARGLLRKHPRLVAPACKQHVSGVLLMLLATLTIVPLAAFGILGWYLTQ
jgi:hypothetical protein